MASGIEFRVDYNGLTTASSDVAQTLAEQLNAIGQSVLSQAQGQTPVLTGELRDSESYVVSGTTVTWTASADHAVYVHEGTRYMGARPFLRTAIEQAGAAIESAIATAVEGLGR